MFDRIKEFLSGGDSPSEDQRERRAPISAVTAWAVAHGVPASVLDDDEEDKKDDRDDDT